MYPDRALSKMISLSQHNLKAWYLSSLSPPFISSFSANEPSPQTVSLMGCCQHPDIYAQFYSKHCPAFSLNWFPDQNNRCQKLPGKQITNILSLCGTNKFIISKMWIPSCYHTGCHNAKIFCHFSSDNPIVLMNNTNSWISHQKVWHYHVDVYHLDCPCQ